MQISAKIIGFVSTLAIALPAYAQEDATGRSTQPANAQALQCLETLDALAQRMNEDGYWLAGYSGYGVDAFGNPAPAGGPTSGTAPGVPSAGTAPVQDDDPARAPAVGESPWVNLNWAERPQYEIMTLFRAANVLASSGNEEGCMAVAEAVEQRYNDYTNQLAELGVDPEEITTWRQAEIAAAVPVSETSYARRVDDMIGTDVRNTEDQDLGDIKDVVLDPGSGDIEYVVVSRGGFFGIGSEEVAVSWESLRVAPGMSTFVLPVDEAAMEQAPQIASENLVDPGQTGSIQRDEVDSYWNQTLNQ